MKTCSRKLACPIALYALLLGVFSTMATMPAAVAQVYKYRDVHGRLVYSDQPPPPGTVVYVVPRLQPSSSGGQAVTREAEQLARWQQAETERVDRDRRAAAENKARDDERERRCIAARRQLAEFGVDGRIYRFDDQNRRVYYSAIEIDRKRAEAKVQLKQYCPSVALR